MLLLRKTLAIYIKLRRVKCHDLSSLQVTEASV